MRNLLFILFFIFGIQLACYSQCNICVKTDPVTGVITLNWYMSDFDGSDFLVTCMDNASSVQVDSQVVPYPGVLQWNQATIANANGLINSYTLKVVPVDNTQTPLSAGYTTSNILLEILPSADQGVAHLSWNADFGTNGSSGLYFVDRYYNASWKTLVAIWNILGTKDYKYNDTLSYPVCNLSTVRYRIRYYCGADPCESASNEAEGNFQSIYFPHAPIRDTVSFNSNGEPVLGWSPPAKANGIKAYRIIRRNPISGTWIDTVAELPSTQLGYTITNTRFYQKCGVNEYWLYSIDSCDRTSDRMSPSSLHTQTMQLTVSSIDPCDRSVNISWTPYINMRGILGGYKIYRQINNQAFTLINFNDPALLSYHDNPPLADGDSVTYYVRAESLDGTLTSTTCKITAHFSGFSGITDLFIQTATVENNQVVDVYAKFLPAGAANSVQLERASSAGGTYTVVATRQIAPKDSTTILVDQTADVNVPNYYRVKAYNSTCTTPIGISTNYARPIVTSLGSLGPKTQVNWSAYEEWPTGVGIYEVYRRMNNGNWQVIGSTHNLSYIDDNAFASTAQVCYMVIARKNNSGGAIIDNSSSNYACTVPENSIIIPSAFYPSSLVASNQKFMPILLDNGITDYRLQIYSKWGQLIYETGDPSEGWDGRSNSKLMPTEVYTYLIRFKSSSGQTVQKRGTVLLVE